MKAAISAMTIIGWALAAVAGVEHYAVEAMNSVRYLPDTPPEGGVKGGEVRFLAAKGEYESASFVLSSDRDVAAATLVWGDLTEKGGARIPASALDVKVVKCWWQQGTAWGGFHADMLRRILTPELLLHDETLVRVDEASKDNYVRCRYQDGSQGYYWLTYLPMDCRMNSGYYGFRNSWVRDAETLQPFSLENGRFKQFWLTLGVPKDAKPGIYRGQATVAADGVAHGVPLTVRILPFALPKPGVFRDPNREFIVSMYMGDEATVLDPKVAENCVRHNLLNPFLGDGLGEEDIKKLYSVIEKFGLNTQFLFAHLPAVFHTMSDPAVPSDADWTRYVNCLRQLSNGVAHVKARFGEQATPFAYGYDEGDAATVLAERAVWRNAHALGARTIVATKMRKFILFGLDAACIPGQPSESRKQWVDTFHASNPDMLIAWYADPHAGPENPDLARRQYGWQSWRNNYDMVCQYTLFRRGWAEFNRPYENDLRSLSMAYAGDGELLDTLQWEGFREGIDDIRYATLLKQLAGEARQSKDVNVQYAGRAALTWLAQVPWEQSSLKALRLETIGKILSLMRLLGKEAL